MNRTWLCLIAFLALMPVGISHSASAAPATHTVDVKLKWDMDVPIRFRLFGSPEGKEAVLTTTTSWSTFPNTTMGLTGRTAWFKVSPIPDTAGFTIHTSVESVMCAPKTKVMVEWYFDGCITHSGTYELSTCNVEIGRYTPGDTCIPRLILDTDFQFDTSLHQDDLPMFVPGSLLDGTSIAPSSMPQSTRIVAVAPKKTTGTVKFELVPASVSRFPGLAMNFPIDSPDTSDDVYFLVPRDPKKPNGELVKGTTVSVSLANGIAAATLYVNDYAAWATVRATITTGKTLPIAVTIRVPQDGDANLLPDAGWPSEPWRFDSMQVFRGDETKDLDANPPGPAQLGDGLSAFEEYRGFVINGTHVRTSPLVRDLFVDKDPEIKSDDFAVLPYQFTFIGPTDSRSSSSDRETFPTLVGALRRTTLTRIRPVINTNRSGVPGTAREQRGLRIIYQKDVPPTKLLNSGGTGPRQSEAWMTGDAGVAFPDSFVNFSIINDAGNAYSVGSPNETAFLELYPQFFANSGIATDDFSNHFNKKGNTVVDCDLAPGPDCDYFMTFPTGEKLLAPMKRENFYVELQSVLDPSRHPADFYSKANRRFTINDDVCDLGSSVRLSVPELAALGPVAVVHETMHGLAAPHTSRCDSLMFSASVFGTQASVLDLYPYLTAPTSLDNGALHLWRP